MSSELAKKAAGTYIADSYDKLSTVLAWVTLQCRTGALAEAVSTFCKGQPERPDQTLVLVEGVTADCIHCRIPCRCYDHEASSTFDSDVRFKLNPQTGECCRS